MAGNEAKTKGSFAASKAHMPQKSSLGADLGTAWLKSCDSPTRFYLDRLEGKDIRPPAVIEREVSPRSRRPTSRLRRMQKPRGIRSSITDCVRWVMSWRLFYPLVA